MFDWLERELRTIKSKRFHVVDGPADAAIKSALVESHAALPPSYREFVRRFGNAKLYQELGYYIVGVRAAPVEEQSRDGESLYRIGHYQSANAYFKAALLRDGYETPVFEGHGGRLVQVADGFEAWLTKRCKAARAKYNQREWGDVVAGPPPFTPEEITIVEARRKFTCRVVGISPQLNFLFEVRNESEMTLRFLSIGVRWKDGGLEGGIWLPTSHIGPHLTAVVEHEGYKGTDISNVEVFLLPDPEPEDRDRYWEFRRLPP